MVDRRELPEVAAAADWWADTLFPGSPHRAAFRAALVDALAEHLAQYSWNPDVPELGSAMRAILNDYGPDPVLADAATAAGVDVSHAPWKTVMWINPGRVAWARNAKDAETVQIYPASGGDDEGTGQ